MSKTLDQLVGKLIIAGFRSDKVSDGSNISRYIKEYNLSFLGYNLIKTDLKKLNKMVAGENIKKTLWNKKKFKPPYKGKPKLEKRLDANLKLIDSFTSQGFKKNQIFITGRSCGGLMTMMLLARHPNIVAGGISQNETWLKYIQ